MADIQTLLFRKIKTKIQNFESLPGMISDILDVGIDGAYRRIRGETILKLDEAVILSQHFRISLDELSQETHHNTVVFRPSRIPNQAGNMVTYLKNLLKVLSDIQRRKVTRSIFSVKDIPTFHLYQISELALFKLFYWRNTIFNDPNLIGEKFSLEIKNEEDQRCVDLCYQIAEKYSLIPTIEIWGEETSLSFIKQVAYYHDAGLFKSKKDALGLCQKIEEYFEHLQKQATLGYKFLINHPPKNRIENYELYFNELVLVDNNIVLEFEEEIEAYLIYNSIEYIGTSNPEFATSLRDWLDNITTKSVMISKTAEKLRGQFFNKIFRRLDELKERIERGD